MCGNLALMGSSSVMCSSVNLICDDYNILQSDILKANRTLHFETPITLANTANAIREFSILKQSHVPRNDQDIRTDEIDAIIQYLCVS